MKNMTKRVLSLLLCIVLCMTMLPGLARAAEGTVPQAAARVRGTRLTDVPVSCGTYQYQPRAAGLTPMEGKLADANLNKAWRSGEQLDECAKGLYRSVLDLAAKNAAGTLASTKYVFTDDDSWVNDYLYWSADMLGVDQIVDNNGNITKAAKEAAASLANDYLVHAFKALLADNPYEFYWYDEIVGVSSEYACSDYLEADNSVWLGITDIWMRVAASQDYAAKNADGTYQTSELDTVKCAATRQAIDKADEIVAAHAGESDFEKLQSYRDAICALTDYNAAAADASNNTPYGNPWQLIWVFDNDPDTKVVCEGYSKAFQLLCDLTKFDQAIDCITVSGNMSGGTGSGGHMWNVVTMEDGKHYIVDVTNCDTRTVGYPDLLFLTGAAEGGSVSGGYRFDCNNTTITYTYDATTRFLFAEAELTLSTTAYTPAAAEGIAVDEINFPDANFRAFVSENCDTDRNGYLSETEIAAVTVINCANKGIASLQGIGFFGALKTLTCYNNELTALDVSQNTALVDLSCSGNQLESLDVSRNTALETLSCGQNQLTALDVSENTALKSLECGPNAITALDVSSNSGLTHLGCGGTELTALDVSSNPNLEWLGIAQTNIAALDLSANTALKILFCYSTRLETLDISACPKLVDAVNGEQSETDGILTYKTVKDNMVEAALMVDSTLTLITEAAQTLPTAIIRSANVMFDGKVYLEFKFTIPDELMAADGANVVFEKNGAEVQRTAVSKGRLDSSTGYYAYYYAVLMPEFADPVTVRIVDENDQPVRIESKSGTDYTAGYSYSVKTYAEKKMVNGSTQEMRDLAKALYDYGTAAQIYFKYGDWESLSVSEEVGAVTLEELTPYKAVITGEKPEGIKSTSLQVYFDSDNTLYVYFTLDGTKSISSYKFYLDGKKVTARKAAENKYYVAVRSIASPNLGDAHEITVRYGTEDYKVTCSAMSYGYTSAKSADVARQNLGKAFYLYYQAANAYFTE